MRRVLLLRLAMIVACFTSVLVDMSPAPVSGRGQAQGAVLRVGPFCPRGALKSGLAAPEAVARAVVRDAHRFLINKGERPYRIVELVSLQPGVDPWADTMLWKIGHVCGASVLDHSWVAIIYFPYWGKINKSAALTNTFLFVAKTAHGWHVWYRTE